MVLASPGPTRAASETKIPGSSIATDRSDRVEAHVKEPPAKVRITPAPVYVPPSFYITRIRISRRASAWPFRSVSADEEIVSIVGDLAIRIGAKGLTCRLLAPYIICPDHDVLLKSTTWRPRCIRHAAQASLTYITPKSNRSVKGRSLSRAGHFLRQGVARHTFLRCVRHAGHGRTGPSAGAG